MPHEILIASNWNTNKIMSLVSKWKQVPLSKVKKNTTTKKSLSQREKPWNCTGSADNITMASIFSLLPFISRSAKLFILTGQLFTSVSHLLIWSIYKNNSKKKTSNQREISEIYVGREKTESKEWYSIWLNKLTSGHR